MLKTALYSMFLLVVAGMLVISVTAQVAIPTDSLTTVVSRTATFINHDTTFDLIDINRRLIASLPLPVAPISNLALSADGQQALIITQKSNTDEEQHGFYHYDLTTNEVLTLMEWSWQHKIRLEGVDFYTPAWSPDGTRLVYFDRFESRYVLVDLRTGRSDTLHELTIAEETLTLVRAPQWSPDGEYIAVSIGDGRLLVIHAATGAARELRVRAFRGVDLVWSPDSRMIAVSSDSRRASQTTIFDAISGQLLYELDGTDVIWCDSEWLVYLTERENISIARLPDDLNYYRFVMPEAYFYSEIRWEPGCEEVVFGWRFPAPLYILDVPQRQLHRVDGELYPAGWVAPDTLLYEDGVQLSIARTQPDVTLERVAHTPVRLYWTDALDYGIGVIGRGLESTLLVLERETGQQRRFFDGDVFIIYYGFWRDG